MPKASVDEDNLVVTWEDKIGFSRQPTLVKAETITKRVNYLAN
jgi:hypothetical protein